MDHHKAAERCKDKAESVQRKKERAGIGHVSKLSHAQTGSQVPMPSGGSHWGDPSHLILGLPEQYLLNEMSYFLHARGRARDRREEDLVPNECTSTTVLLNTLRAAVSKVCVTKC